MSRLQAGERLEVGTLVTVGNMRGKVVGHVEPENWNQVVAHEIRFTEKAKVRRAWSAVTQWEPLAKPVRKGCNYSFISY